MCLQRDLLRLCLGLVFLAGLFSARSASAQTAATIVGDIKDSSGAAAPNVAVTVVNEGTRIERKVQTNEAGQYRVSPLNPGTYTIQVEAPGFKKQVRSGVVLEVAAVLEPGRLGGSGDSARCRASVRQAHGCNDRRSAIKPRGDGLPSR